MATTRLCSVDGCGKAARKRGWCEMHYSRYRRNGDPLEGRTPPGEPLEFIEKVLTLTSHECVVWPYAKTSKGRALIHAQRTTQSAARVVCERAHGEPPTPDHEAAHSCGKGHEGCVNPHHLRWATPVENEADKRDHGTHLRGRMCGASKLADADVLDIRRRIEAGESQGALAREYGVSQPAISRIVKRENWGWL